MSELDEMLGKKAPEVKPASKSEFKLEDLDPVFEKPMELPAEKESKLISAEMPSNVAPAAAAGAATGYVAGKFIPSIETKAPAMANRTIEAEVAKKAAERQVANLSQAKTGHATNIDSAFQELNVLKAKADEAAQRLAAVRERAMGLGAIPEPKPIVPTTAVGSSEVPGSLSQGSLRHSEKMGEITEANKVRKGIAGTAKGLPLEQRMPLTGFSQNSRVIVPDYLAQAPIYTQEQLAVQRELQQAQTMFENAQKQATGAQAKWQGLTKSVPRGVTTAEVGATRATEKAMTAADRLAELQKLKPSMVSKMGSAISRIPGLNIFAGGLTAAEAMNAYEQGLTTEGVMSGLGATGGALMMVPHPAAKLVGGALSIPPLVYQGYKALSKE